MIQKDFNLMVSSILVFYSKFLDIPEAEILHKINQFNLQFDNQIKQANEQSIQLGQNDQTTN